MAQTRLQQSYVQYVYNVLYITLHVASGGEWFTKGKETITYQNRCWIYRLP